MPGRPALALLILVCLPPHNTVLSYPVAEEEADRGRSLYPYLPRNVGKDSFYREYRGLIPFPRVGRATNTWDLPPNLIDEVLPETDMKIKKASRSTAADQSAFNRRLLRSAATADSKAFNRRLLRSMPNDAFNRRLLRSSQNAFNRRLLKRSGKYDSFSRRLLRSASPAAVFNRRLLRSDPTTYFNHQRSDAFKRRLLKKSAVTPGVHEPPMTLMAAAAKRQSLIPFPRTGKRSEVALPVVQEMDTLQQRPPQMDTEEEDDDLMLALTDDDDPLLEVDYEESHNNNEDDLDEDTEDQ